ncbi:cupredoxin domain-containing protein [Zobellella maritima]|uniref:quinol oxidase n=1 Tax=Zobellella maritima TaxID=2059725 RepID=UPI0018E57DFE|nr:quinol oxidase [Zobellella maritima]
MMARYKGWLLGVALLLAGPALSAPLTATIAADGVQRVHIKGGSHFFNPDHIVVKVGVPVELVVSKEPGLVPHSLVIWSPRAGIDVDITLGERETRVNFTPRAVGSITFYCQEKLLFFASHKEKGMVGTLEVVE